jgi:hypothetical protein
MGVLNTCLSRHLGLRCGSLRLVDATSTTVAAVSLLIGPLIITIIVFHPRWSIIGVSGGS